MVYLLLFADSRITSGVTARCTADMTATSLSLASATVVLMLDSTQVIAMVDQRRFEDVRRKKRGDVHGRQSVVHDQTITSRPAVVAQQNENVTDIPAHPIAIKEAAGLQTNLPTATEKSLGMVTVSGKAIVHAHENTVTRTVTAATTRARVKTATIGRHEIEGHLWQTVGDHGRQNLMIRLNRILGKNFSALGSPGRRKSKMVAVINRPDVLVYFILCFIISEQHQDCHEMLVLIVCKQYTGLYFSLLFGGARYTTKKVSGFVTVGIAELLYKLLC